MTARWDALVVGAGHNGLVAAFYLARAGRRVLVLELHHQVGGCAVTEEFHPGFRNSVASYTVSLLQPRIIADMALGRHGLRVVRRPLANWLPLPDGRSLSVGGGMAATQAEFARFSARDANRYPAYAAMVERAADRLRTLALKPPPAHATDLLAHLAEALALARAPIEDARDLHAFFTRSAADILEQWFETPAIQAVFGFDSIVGAWQSPRTPGSAYVLLHHLFGEVDGEKGAWGHAIGGMGAITQAMARACEEAGVTIRTGAPVASIRVESGRATGAILASGEEIAARHILSNLGPRPLFERLVDPADLDPDFRARIAAWRVGSGSFRMNVALAALPRFIARPEPGPNLSAGIILAPSLDYMHRAHRDSEDHGWSRAPIVEMLIPSTLDDSLAPPGQHVASLFCQQFAPTLPHGRDWDAEEQAAADTILDTVEAAAPGFRHLILGTQILSPRGLERRFGLAGGDIFHGSMGLDQLWAARPVLGAGRYRMPIAGLYLCGAGAHPGGGVTGAPGYNAARAVLRDG
jgi:phytoene dehydrogenase-like protein